MSLTKRILANTAWMVLGRIALALLGIISIKTITNYLPTDVYGQYTTVYEFIGFFAIAADFGLYTIGVREMSKKIHPEHEILGNILTVRLILIILLLGLAIPATHLIPKYADTFVSKGILLVAITTGLNLLHGTLSSVLQYRLKMFYANLSLVISRVITIGYMLLTVFYISPDNIDMGFNHLLLAGLIGNVILVIITSILCSRYVKIRFRFNKTLVKEILIKAAPLGLSLILSTIYFKIDIILISLMRSYHETGVYGVPIKFMEILTVLPLFFMNSALPSITESFHNNKERFLNLLQKCWKFLALLMAPILVGGLILAFPITFIISNPQFLSGFHCVNDIRVVTQSKNEAATICQSTKLADGFNWPTESVNQYVYLKGSDQAFKLILFGVFFSSLNIMATFSLIAIDKQNRLLIINSFGVIFNLIMNLIFIPKYGFLGSATITAISQLLVLTTSLYLLKREVTFRIPLFFTLKALFSATIMGAVILLAEPIIYHYFQNYGIFALIPLGGLIYAAAILNTKTFTLSEIKEYLNPKV